MKKWLIRVFSCIVILTLNVLSLSGQESNMKTIDDKDFTLANIIAKDALGRELPAIRGYRKDRYVGLFYFTWLGQQGEPQTKVYDITKLLKEDRKSLFELGNDVAPTYYNYFFNEPLYGYYNSADPWVIRKHIEMLIAADIDFIAIDFTNAIVYAKVLPNLLNLLLEYQNAGWKVPQVMFFTNTQSGNVVRTLYNGIYKQEKYNSLWFKGNQNKPYIIAIESELTEEIKEFFYIRPPQWPEAEYNELGFPYVEKVRPQRLFYDLMSVSVAQHTGGAFSFSVEGVGGKKNESWGRGYSSKNPKNGDVEAILRGDNFQDQWDVAIATDPEIIFLTSWNEWTALKLTADWAGTTPLWVDTFNTEFSRDIEMTKNPTYVMNENGEYIKEGYGDNYYLQMISNIRKYKGISPSEETDYVPISKTIDIKGAISQWDDIRNKYLNISTDKIERAYYGYVKSDEYYYEQAAPANFITDIKVTYDKNNIYFLINTKDKITAHNPNATNWMNLFLSIKNSDAPSWEGFHYVLNRNPISDTKTSLEKVSKKDTYTFKEVAQVDYIVKDNTMQISIPRKIINLNKKLFSFSFKVTDSIENESDIMDYYVSGDSVPMGRLTYSFTNMTAKQQLDNHKSFSLLEFALLFTSFIIIGACAFVLIKKKRNMNLINL